MYKAYATFLKSSLVSSEDSKALYSFLTDNLDPKVYFASNSLITKVDYKKYEYELKMFFKKLLHSKILTEESYER